MKYSTLVLALLGFVMSTASRAEEATWSFPDPAEYMAHVTEICKPESSSALFIAALRDKGSTKDQVAARLPQGTPDRIRLTHVVRENLNDLYAFPDVTAISYYAFRGASCVREKVEGKAPIAFATIATDVVACQKKHGAQNRPGLAGCIRALIR